MQCFCKPCEIVSAPSCSVVSFGADIGRIDIEQRVRPVIALETIKQIQLLDHDTLKAFMNKLEALDESVGMHSATVEGAVTETARDHFTSKRDSLEQDESGGALNVG